MTDPARYAEIGQEAELTLEQDLACTLNRHSMENASNTPDFILARFLLNALAGWNAATRSREDWDGDIRFKFDPQPLDARAHAGDGDGAARETHAMPPTPKWERANANGRHVRMRKIIGAGCVNEAQVVNAPGPVRLFFEGGSSEVVHGRLAEFVVHESWWVESASGRCYVISEAVKFDLFDEQGPRLFDGQLPEAMRRDLGNARQMIRTVEEFLTGMERALP